MHRSGGAAAAPAWSGDIEPVRNFFRERFGRDLPLTAEGQTDYHQRKGLNHAGRYDIGVHPDSEEGLALSEHLTASGVPFSAFRSARGVITGPHIHIGPHSLSFDAERELDALLDGPEDSAAARAALLADPPAPERSPQAGAIASLEQLRRRNPETAAQPEIEADEVLTVSAKATPPPAPEPFYKYSVEGRRQRDAILEERERGGARVPVTVSLPAGKDSWEEVTPGELAEMGLLRGAESEGVPEEFARAWMAKHPERVRLVSVNGEQAATLAEVARSEAFDPKRGTVTLALSAVPDMARDYRRSRGASARAVDTLADPNLTAGEKLLGVGSDVLDVASRPLQAASTLVAGQQRRLSNQIGALLPGEVGDANREVYDSGLYSYPNIARAVWQEFTTGETAEGYENPVGEGLDLLHQLRTGEKLPGWRRALLDVIGDPTTYMAAKLPAAPLTRGAVALLKRSRLGWALRTGAAAADDFARAEQVLAKGGRIADVDDAGKVATILDDAGRPLKFDTETGEIIDDAAGAARWPEIDRARYAGTPYEKVVDDFHGGDPHGWLDYVERQARAHGRHAEHVAEVEQVMGREAADELRRRLADAPAAAYAGDAVGERLPDLISVGAHHIAAGARNLDDFTRAMVDSLGEAIRPHARNIFEAAGGRVDDALEAAPARVRDELDELLDGPRGGEPSDASPSILDDGGGPSPSLGRPSSRLGHAVDAVDRGVLRAAGEVSDAINFPKAVLTSFDASGTTRQAGPLLATRRGYFRGMMRDQAKALRSETNFQNFVEGVRGDELFEQAREDGLRFASLVDRDAPRYARDDSYASKWADKIPGVRASERGFLAAQDSVRFQAYKLLAPEVTRGAKPLEAQKARKALVAFLNNTTGYGIHSKRGQQIASFLRLPFFSPQQAVARLKTLNYFLNPVTYARLPQGARRVVARESFRILQTYGAILGVASLGGASVGLNPFAPGFGRIRVGQTEYDVTGGRAYALQTVAQLAASLNGWARGERQGEGKDPLSVGLHYGRTQLAPLPGRVADYKTGETLDRLPFTASGAAWDSVMPLVAQDVVEGYREAGAAGALLALPAVVGVGVNTYPPPAGEVAREAARVDIPGAAGVELERLGIDLNYEGRGAAPAREGKFRGVPASVEGVDGDSITFHPDADPRRRGNVGQTPEHLASARAEFERQVADAVEAEMAKPGYQRFKDDAARKQYLTGIVRAVRGRVIRGFNRETRGREIVATEAIRDFQRRLEERSTAPPELKQPERVRRTKSERDELDALLDEP